VNRPDSTLQRLPDMQRAAARVASGGALEDKAHWVNVSGCVMPAFICETCGSQFTPSDAPPRSCPICEDERQFVPAGGQRWTTLDALARRHFNCYQQHESGLIGVGTVPKFSIGPRALILRAGEGNILWDCIPFIDAATVEIVKGLGGLSGIAISHPHYYATMVEWSRAFGGVPIHLHAADRQWIMRPDPAIKLWEGDTLPLAREITLIRCGGHFAGGTVLHWAAGGEGRGALLSGDIVQLIPDRKYVSFMRSYPNIIPLSAPAVARIGAVLEPWPFDVIYGAFFDRVIARGGKDAVRRSVKRYIAIYRGRRHGGAGLTKARLRPRSRRGTGPRPYAAAASHRVPGTLGDRRVFCRLSRRMAVGSGLCRDRDLRRHRSVDA